MDGLLKGRYKTLGRMSEMLVYINNIICFVYGIHKQHNLLSSELCHSPVYSSEDL